MREKLRQYNSEEEPSREMFADLYEIIQENQKQIEDLRNRLQELKGVIICKVCGTELSRDAKFCGSCGAKIEKEQPEKPLICPVCGGELKDTDVFCKLCGSPVK